MGGSAAFNAAHLTVPLLVMSMSAHYFMVMNEITFDHAAPPDKKLVVVEGADHWIRPCEASEETPGQLRSWLGASLTRSRRTPGLVWTPAAGSGRFAVAMKHGAYS